MAGDWGSKKNGVKIGVFWDGIEYNSDQSKARITNGRVRIDRDVNIIDSTNKLSVSGSAVTDASWSNLNVSGSGAETIKNVDESWVTLAYGSTTNANFNATMTGVDYADGTLTASDTVTFPARPYTVPNAPTSLAATRSSDTSYALSWTNKATTEAPYTAVVLQRRENDGAGWTAWTTVYSGAPKTSHTDTGTVADKIYQWQVYATNASGDSSTALSGTRATTVTTPGTLTAVRTSDAVATLSWSNPTTLDHYSTIHIERWSASTNSWVVVKTVLGTVTTTTIAIATNNRYQFRLRALATADNAVYSAYSTSGYIVTTPIGPGALNTSKSGTTIRLSWTNNHVYATAVYVEKSTNNGSSWAALHTLGASATSDTDTVTSGTAMYRVRVYNGSQYSAYSTGGNVLVDSQPNTPTVNLNRTVIDADTTSITVSWVHNPTDSSAQQNARYRWSYDNATWVPAYYQVTTAVSGSFTKGTFDNGKTVYVQVCTKGNHASYSNWSTSKTFVTSAAPAVGFTNYADNDVITDLSFPWFEFSYYDEEGTPQVGWQATLATGDGVIESLSGTTESSVQFSKAFADATEYTVTVTVTDGSGLTGSSVIHVSTDYALPPVPSVSVEWVPEFGHVVVSATCRDAVGAETDAYALSIVRRTENGWTAWVAWDGRPHDVDGIPVAMTAIDPIPPTNSTVYYRVEAIAEVGTSSFSEPEPVETPSDFVYLNAGEQFDKLARIIAAPAVDVTKRREKVLHRFAGRTKPVEFIGRQTETVLRLSGNVDGFGNHAELGGFIEWEDIATEAAPLCYRDPFRRLFVSLNEESVGHAASTDLVKVAVTLTEIDYNGEAY